MSPPEQNKPGSAAMFQLHDTVKLKTAHPAAHGYGAVRAGQTGAVVHVFNTPSVAYEVEFCHANGETLAMLTLTSAQIEHLAVGRVD